jgi:3-hydroxybutyryl-CoA dehydrogenase
MSKEAMTQDKVNRVAVIGAGLMGFGIAVEFARFGYDVHIFNTTEKSSRYAMTLAREALDLMKETELITSDEAEKSYHRIRPFTDIEDTATGADLVVESVVEVLDLKKDIFSHLDRICPPPAILATNTSGFRVTDIAEATKHPERVLAAHYFQPPHFVPLVEVVPGKRTHQSVVDRTAKVLQGMRKKVAVLNMDIAGFVGNRIQGVMAREIQTLVDKGVCTPETIDDVISFGFGRRMAYTAHFKRLDLIGLDLIDTMSRERGFELWKPIADRVKRGELGMKSGKGFYPWPHDTGKEFHRWMNLELIRLMKQDMSEGRI